MNKQESEGKFDYAGMYDYVKGCKLYRDGTIRDAEGKIVGGVDTDSEAWREIFNKRTEAISFHIVKDSRN